jgi:hypothetical protein
MSLKLTLGLFALSFLGSVVDAQCGCGGGGGMSMGMGGMMGGGMGGGSCCCCPPPPQVRLLMVYKVWRLVFSFKRINKKH